MHIITKDNQGIHGHHGQQAGVYDENFGEDLQCLHKVYMFDTSVIM